MLSFEQESVQSHSLRQAKGVGKKWTLPPAIACTLATMPRGSLGLLTQLYLKNLNISPFLISLATSIGCVGILLGGLFGGTLSDSYRRKLLLFVLLSAGVLAMSVQAFLLPPGVLAGVFFIVFMLTGFIPIAMVIISTASSSLNRGRNLSILHASRSLGFMFGGVMAGFVLQSIGV